MSHRLPLRTLLAFLAALSVGTLCSAADPAPVALTIHTDKVANPINPFIYGHFFEHIYNGGDNGLWGEMVWNRSFEYKGDDRGKWEIKDGVIRETAHIDGARIYFGDPSWKDYEFTVKARKISGDEGFLILFRATEEKWF